MGAACCNHRTHRKSNLRQHLTSSSTAQIYGNEIKEKNDSKQKTQDNMNKYIGELENRIKTYEK